MKQKNFLSILLCFFLAVNFFAANIYVGTTITDGGATLGSEANPYPVLSDAITAAIDNDKIIIVGTVPQTGEVTLDKNLTFEGQSDAIITGNGSNRLFVVSGEDLTISFTGIVFQGIASSDPGSGVTTDFAGGVLFNSQLNFSLTISNCVFSGNSSTSTSGGGALYLSGGGSTTANISNSTFYNNQILTATTGEARGGAIIVYNATVNLSNCTFFENKLARAGNFHGAAIRASANDATVTATNCLFYNNRSNGGAGDYSDFNAVPGATMTTTNCLAQYQNNLDTNNNSTINNSDYLSTSNIAWNASTNRVEFTAPNALTDTPIDFGNDNNDAGAWDSGINIFEGTTSILWYENSNWSSGTAPVGDGTENIAIIGAICNMFIAGVAVNNIKVTTELRIQGQNVFIVNGTSDVTGIVRYFANLQDDADNTKAWYLVSSPLSGEVFDDAFADKNDIAAGSGSKRGIATYNPGETGNAAWTYFSDTNNSIAGTSGQGFSLKITPDGTTFADGGGEYADNEVGFEGDFNTDNSGVTVNTNATGFNLLGNPYTAHVNSTTFLGAATSANIDQSQVWVWNQTLNSGAGDYEVKGSGEGFVLAPAQGFFVDVNSTGSVNFAEANQATTGGTFQKTARTELKLLVSDNQNSRFAKLYFLNDATKGFDFGWEGELFGGISNSLELYTQLVDENVGKKFQLQSLSKSDVESSIIPVGINAESGKELTFSLESQNFPTGIKIYLEDRQNNTFNEISDNKTYRVSLSENLNDIGRFYIHTSSSALSAGTFNSDKISIYPTDKSTLRIVGLSHGKTNVKLFNVLGKQVLRSSFTSNGVYDLNLPKITTGVYIVQIETETGNLNKKIVL